MDEICYILGCPGTAKFTCSCDSSLRVCQEHIAEHIQGTEYHEISSSKLGLTQKKASDALKSLNKLNTSTLQKGKEMFKELYNKICTVVDNLSSRQQCIIDLSESSYSDEIGQKIKDLEEVNIGFRNKSEFRNLLDKFMSPSENTFEGSNFDHFQKEFGIIAQSIEKSNEVLEAVAASNKIEQVLREKLEKRIKKLEKKNKKAENTDQRVMILEAKAEDQTKHIQDFKKVVEKVSKDVKGLEKMFKEKTIEFQRKAKQQADKFEAVEDSIRKTADEVSKSFNERGIVLGEKIRKIEEIQNPGFKQGLERFFNEVNLRRIVKKIQEIERQEITRKQVAEEAERKRAEAERKRVEEEKKRIEDEAKVLSEKS